MHLLIPVFVCDRKIPQNNKLNAIGSNPNMDIRLPGHGIQDEDQERLRLNSIFPENVLITFYISCSRLPINPKIDALYFNKLFQVWALVCDSINQPSDYNTLCAVSPNFEKWLQVSKPRIFIDTLVNTINRTTKHRQCQRRGGGSR